MQLSNVMTITKAGQVTVPKEVRNILKTNSIIFEISDDYVIQIIPVQSVAGALNEFSKSKEGNFKSVRKKVWVDQTQKFNSNKNQ